MVGLCLLFYFLISHKHPHYTQVQHFLHLLLIMYSNLDKDHFPFHSSRTLVKVSEGVFYRGASLPAGGPGVSCCYGPPAGGEKVLSALNKTLAGEQPPRAAGSILPPKPGGCTLDTCCQGTRRDSTAGCEGSHLSTPAHRGSEACRPAAPASPNSRLCSKNTQDTGPRG